MSLEFVRLFVKPHSSTYDTPNFCRPISEGHLFVRSSCKVRAVRECCPSVRTIVPGSCGYRVLLEHSHNSWFLRFESVARAFAQLFLVPVVREYCSNSCTTYHASIRVDLQNSHSPTILRGNGRIEFTSCSKGLWCLRSV